MGRRCTATGGDSGPQNQLKIEDRRDWFSDFSGIKIRPLILNEDGWSETNEMYHPRADWGHGTD